MFVKTKCFIILSFLAIACIFLRWMLLPDPYSYHRVGETEKTTVLGYNGHQSNQSRIRYIIYLCNGRRLCGGWADRQRGIVAAYLLANVTGRRFGIQMTHPSDIKLFYIPNIVNWYIQESKVQGLSKEYLGWIDNRKGPKDVNGDFNAKHPSDVIFLSTNMDIITLIQKSPQYGHVVPEPFRNPNRGKVFHTIWHLLMKPSLHFEERIDMFMIKLPRTDELVCAHVRMRRNPTIPNDGAQINSLSTVKHLWTFLSKFKNASRIFIASDSMDVRLSARKYFGAREIDTDGLVLHIDRQAHLPNAVLGFEMALLDQAVLSRCQVLVVSKSGFSVRAAMMSHKHQELYEFNKGMVTPYLLLESKVF
ncbi:uncharacterized protein LOC124284366 [Haliotis rubra]|uniref:uncharacterized protein LOC124284366 n=1 Tax=Haliotis rubra TaxID=36100 RepID=UPI001EE52FB0|nr:uncharacterized protein LOC124284366 [Haliotis rubra]